MGADTHSPRKRVSGKDELSTQFDRSISLVRDYSYRIERDYARPAMKSSRLFFLERPIAATFVAIFAFLTFLPVLSFLGVSVLTILTFTAIALAGGIVASSAVVLGLFAILGSILTAAFFASILLTFVTISSFLLYRFAVLVREEGSPGISSWATESRRRFVNNAGTQQPSKQIHSDSKLIPDDNLSDSTNESGVIVQTQPEEYTSKYLDSHSSADESDVKVPAQD